MRNMKAKFYTIEDENRYGDISKYRKEDKYYKSLMVIDNDLNMVADMRFYGTNATTYACLWVRGDDYRSGGGSAGGYGYHRASQAAENAIISAGIKLSEPIGGCGDSLVEDALIAIAKKATGKRKFKIVRAHA